MGALLQVNIGGKHIPGSWSTWVQRQDQPLHRWRVAVSVCKMGMNEPAV